MKWIDSKFWLFRQILLFLGALGTCTYVSKGQAWPSDLPTANKMGVATLTRPDLLTIPSAVQYILDSNLEIQLDVVKVAPKVKLVYFNQLPGSSFNGTTSKGKLFRYFSSKYQLDILGSNFLVKGETITAYTFPREVKIDLS